MPPAVGALGRLRPQACTVQPRAAPGAVQFEQTYQGARPPVPSVSRMDRPLNSPIACRHEECAKQARAPQLMPLARRPGREYADCLGNRRLKRRLSLRHAKKRAFHGRGKLLLVGIMRQQKLP